VLNIQATVNMFDLTQVTETQSLTIHINSQKPIFSSVLGLGTLLASSP